MKAEQERLRQWAYRSVHLVIAVGGLAAITGSGGGGSGGGSSCPPHLCQEFVWVTVQPAVRQTAQLGQTVSFRAVASGTVPTERYQWCRYAPGASICVPIPGATGSTLTIQNVNLADDQARYEVTASGHGTPATSHTDSARLLVATAPAVVFQDGEFLEADWVWSGFVGGYGSGAPSSALRVTRPTSGGNPGAYRAIEYGPLSSGDRMFATHLAQAATYDPGQLGAIYAIDFRAECKGLAGYGGRMSVRPLLRQGARTYATTGPLYGQSCEESSWAFDSSIGSIVASNFAQILSGPPCGAGESCPDFSASGAPITFGMFTANDYVNPGPTGVASHGVDNWRMSVWRR